MNFPVAFWAVLIIVILLGAVGLGFWVVGAALKIALYVLLGLLLIWAITSVWRKIKANT